jgi:hypothetical protein
LEFRGNLLQGNLLQPSVPKVAEEDQEGGLLD